MVAEPQRVDLTARDVADLVRTYLRQGETATEAASAVINDMRAVGLADELLDVVGPLGIVALWRDTGEKVARPKVVRSETGSPMTMRYVYLGTRGTDPRWIDQPCDPVLRADGKALVSRSPRNQLVRFEDGTEVVVSARRLRLTPAHRAAARPSPCEPTPRRGRAGSPTRGG